MINFLSNIFRGLSFIFGITAPRPEENQRPFVYMWLGIIGFLLLVSVLLYYWISHVHLR
jgi:hypothetical protein